MTATGRPFGTPKATRSRYPFAACGAFTSTPDSLEPNLAPFIPSLRILRSLIPPLLFRNRRCATPFTAFLIYCFSCFTSSCICIHDRFSESRLSRARSMMEFPPAGRRLRDYVDALEEERRKIQVFQRELPFCMQLVSHAIETCKQQMATEVLFPGRSDGEATSSEGPILEFIPIKRSSSSEVEKSTEKDEREAPKKPDWLRSVQLWTQDNDPPPKEESRSLVEPRKAGGAFQPFTREDKRPAAPAPGPTAAASSTADTGSGREEKEGQSAHRKARRCWSPELHRRFLHALQQLGGCHAATPKQIRELMKVDGLTNDEVKSHLQKYRLHTRRPSPTTQATNPPPPQFVVVGGIWVPPPDYTAAVAAGAQPSDGTSGGPASEIYAPVAKLPQSPKSQQKLKKPQQSPSGPLNSGDRGSRELHSLGDDSAQSHSPATSSSSHTTTTSPAY
ncbi:hypothetical protein H6P81_009528 [Aristolochia fimbriata]|uniref:HTH myb-type domain-containing protein n=1 Tax=Aristolochia fimbriata TaxID=158543 RepID=A0AAV7ELA3_ARIFI|nr:hypothetical protein H6P81_009528 [Aristolochia fimbriata]